LRALGWDAADNRSELSAGAEIGLISEVRLECQPIAYPKSAEAIQPLLPPKTDQSQVHLLDEIETPMRLG